MTISYVKTQGRYGDEQTLLCMCGWTIRGNRLDGKYAGWEKTIVDIKHAHRKETVQPEEAEGCFQQALTVARRQQAKSLELRAACGSSRASRRKRGRFCRRSMAGSPRGLTPPTCRTPKPCWRRWWNK